MKGIILAGGSGTRLYPLTISTSKQLLPVYDKPMIYYPLSTLMLSDIKEILIITTPHDCALYQRLLGDGAQFGISLQYKIQESPKGLADAFIVGKEFIGNDRVCLILGDNIFYGQHFSPKLLSAKNKDIGATLFAYQVQNPKGYGVVEFDKNNNAISLEEKPISPRSNYAVTGLYFYDNDVVEIAKEIKPSQRGELEITSINKIYLEQGKMNVEVLGRGFAWLDTGSHENLIEASEFIYITEKRQGFKIACLEEIAYTKGWVTQNELEEHLKNLGDNGYKSYIQKLL